MTDSMPLFVLRIICLVVLCFVGLEINFDRGVLVIKLCWKFSWQITQIEATLRIDRAGSSYLVREGVSIPGNFGGLRFSSIGSCAHAVNENCFRYVDILLALWVCGCHFLVNVTSRSGMRLF